MRIEYLPNQPENPKPFILHFMGKKFKFDFQTLGRVYQMIEDAFEKYALDRGGPDPRNSVENWREEIDKL